MARNFKNKVAIVTGSSSGIGEDIAVHLCNLGANVTITGRNAARLENVAKRCLSSSSSGKILKVICDINKEEDAKLLLCKTIEEFGKLDILVNNAGIYQICSILDDKAMHVFDEIFKTNVRSVVYLTKICVPYLSKTKGNIVNVSSVASYKPAAINTFYAMSKSSIDMFTKCMAIELGPKGIRVNAINPAAIRTPIFSKVENSNLDSDKIAEIVSKSYPIGRIGEPKDCAHAVAYLASDEASFITGVCLLVDGGAAYMQLVMPDNN